jgi:hypothetical protein
VQSLALPQPRDREIFVFRPPSGGIGRPDRIVPIAHALEVFVELVWYPMAGGAVRIEVRRRLVSRVDLGPPDAA